MRSLFQYPVIVQFILITSALCDHLSYVFQFYCSIESSHEMRPVTVQFILMIPVLSDHLSYVIPFQCSLER